MNCVANILHKICNASVFFSAYRTCYNSIVKIEQKRKSAFFRGRSFCLEVVEISREERDVYLIPQNFVDTGTILGGTVKLRNAVEAAVLAVGSAVPLFYLPLAFNIRLMIVIAVSVPLGVFGVVGIGGDSLTQFVVHWFRFIKRRRIVTPTPQGNLGANRHRHLRFISKRYRVIYYDDSDALPHNAQVLQRKTDRHGKLVKRQTLYDLLPIEKIENGILHTTDDRYIKILEIEPINFLLRSPREQRSVIYSFASLLKVSPVRLQFKSFSRKADVNAYLDKLRRDAARQRLACQRAARKLQWGVQKERISETNEPVPLLMRPAVKEILQDAEQHRFDVLLIGNRDSLCCDAADMESFLTVLNSFNIHIFAGGQGSWVEPNGRHYAPLPRLPWQEDDVAEVPQ